MSSRLGPVVGHEAEAEADDGQAWVAEPRDNGDRGYGPLGGSDGQ